MNNLLSKNNKGFTLVEMLIYIGIFSVFIVTINIFFNMISSYRNRGEMIMEVNDQGSLTVRTITRSIRNAKSISIPISGSSGSSLTLETYDPLTNPTIFSLTENGVLQIKEGGEESEFLLNDKVIIENLIFSNIGSVGGSGAIEFSFRLKNRSSIKKSENFSSDFYGTASIR